VSRVQVREIPRGQQLLVDGAVVHSLPADFSYFKKWLMQFDLVGKRVLMGGLGFGCDALHCVSQGAQSVTVVELVPEVIDLFEPHPLINVVCADWNTYVIDYDMYDLVIYSIDDYKVLERK